MGEGRDVYRVFLGKPGGRRPLGRPRHGWEDNIKMDLPEVGCRGLECFNLAEDTGKWWVLVNAIMNLQAP
jgi:hypothetical protein